MCANQPEVNFASTKEDTLKLKVSVPDGLELDIKLGTKRKVDFDDVISGHSYFITAFGFNASGVGELANVIEVTAP